MDMKFLNNISNAEQVRELSNCPNPIKIQTAEAVKHTEILNETKKYSAKNLQQLELMHKMIIDNQKETTLLNRITIIFSFLTLVTTIVVAFFK